MRRNYNFRKIILPIFFLTATFIGFAQQRTVSGTITSSADGQPIPGVSVIIKGTAIGVSSDFDGNYSINNIDDTSVLQFSFLGFKTKEVAVKGLSTINVSLVENASQLDEVVVTGYSKQSRTTLTTSIAKVDSRVLETASFSNAGQALQGTIAGLTVVNTTGQPGSSPSIVLRGGTSFGGGGTPLILVDGVRTNTMYGLNTDDIESMEVLKDAAATAIYGAQAANGVILVTTKSGKVGKSSIKYGYKYSMNEKRADLDYVGAADFISYNRQAVAYYREASGSTGFGNFLNGATAFGTGNNTTNSPYTVMLLGDDNRYLLSQPGWSTIQDPLDPSQEILFQENLVDGNIYQNSSAKDHYLSFDGGNEKGTYYLGLGALDNDGIIWGSGFKRYSGNFRASYKVTNNVTANANVNYRHSNLSSSPLGAESTVFRRLQGQPPTSRVYNNNDDGTLSSDLNPGTNSSFGNPLYYRDKFIRKNIFQQLTISAGLDWEPIDNLVASIQGSHYATNNRFENFNKAYLVGQNLNTQRDASASYASAITNQLTAKLAYGIKIKEHNLNAFVGAEYLKTNGFSLSASTRNSPTDLIETLNAGAEPSGASSSRDLNSLTSIFGQLTYDFSTRYLLTFNFRHDGSSRLAPGNKFDFFPGVSVGWNIHNEDFFRDSKLSKVISKVKPRFSYGVNGNLGTIGSFQVFGAYGSRGVYDGNTGYANTGIPTPDLVWERANSYNYGLDLGLFNNRVSIIADAYTKNIEGLITNRNIPLWTGFSGISTNNGSFIVRGLDLEVSADIIKTQDFTWNVRGIYTNSKRYVDKLPENDNDLNRQGGAQIYNSDGELEWVGGLQEGKRVGTDLLLLYEQEYIYRDQAAVDEHAGREDVLLPNRFSRFPGDVAWKDVNGDNIINSNDRVISGRTTPDFTGGLSTNINYKGLNLFVRTNFAFGHKIYNNALGKGLAQTQGNLNQPTQLLDTWTPDNRDTDLPRFVFVDYQRNISRGVGNGSASTRFWEKGDYLALAEVSLSYNVPTKYFKDKISSLRVFASGNNLHYFKSFTGDTPELGGSQQGEFPISKTYTIGVNVTF